MVGYGLGPNTNDLDSPAQEIADLYKARWKIELFFRWLKQNLRIRHFLGTSRNAVRIQIAVGIIVYLVLRFLHKASSTPKSFTTFTRNFGHCLFKTTTLPQHIERLETVLRDQSFTAINSHSSYDRNEPDSRGLVPTIHDHRCRLLMHQR